MNPAEELEPPPYSEHEQAPTAPPFVTPSQGPGYIQNGVPVPQQNAQMSRQGQIIYASNANAYPPIQGLPKPAIYHQNAAQHQIVQVQMQDGPHQQQQMTPSALFESNPKWQCCCGCHVTQGAQIIGFVYIGLAVLGMVFSLILHLLQSATVSLLESDKEFARQNPDVELQQPNVGQLVLIVIYQGSVVVVNALLIYALRSAKTGYMWPWLCYHGLQAIGQYLFVFPVWFWYIVFCAFNYINEKPSI